MASFGNFACRLTTHPRRREAARRYITSHVETVLRSGSPSGEGVTPGPGYGAGPARTAVVCRRGVVALYERGPDVCPVVPGLCAGATATWHSGRSG